MLRKQRRRKLGIQPLEERALLTTITQVDYFDTWDGGVIPSTDVAGIAYHPDSGSLYLADSEINEYGFPSFVGNNIFETTPNGDPLLRAIASGNTEPTGITFNEKDGFFYVTKDTSPKTVTRYDVNFNSDGSVSTTDFGFSDPEGITSDPSTGLLYVTDGLAKQVFVLDSNLVHYPALGFFVGDHLQDPEGIAFDPHSGNLFLVSASPDVIAEYSIDGSFVAEYDISGFQTSSGVNPVSPQGLTFAPTSDPSDDDRNLALYIADLGADGVPDGGVFEAVFLRDDEAPAVDAGADQVNVARRAKLDGAVTDNRLSKNASTITTNWIQVSGPPGVIFRDASAIDTTVKFPQKGTYVLRLTADNGESVSSDDVTIIVSKKRLLTLESRVDASSDDAEEKATGAMRLTGADLELVQDDTLQKVGIRFNGLSIPRGSYIVDAYIQFQADEVQSEETALIIRGEAHDDAPAFASTRWNVSSRATTNASATWHPAPWTTEGEAGPAQNTTSLVSIVQEIVNRPGWEGGNSVVFIVSGSGHRTAEAYDGIAAAAPMLHLEFAVSRANIAALPLPWQTIRSVKTVRSASAVPALLFQSTQRPRAAAHGNLTEIREDFDESLRLMIGNGEDKKSRSLILRALLDDCLTNRLTDWWEPPMSG